MRSPWAAQIRDGRRISWSALTTRAGAQSNNCCEAYDASIATTSHLDRLLEPLTEAFTPKMALVLLELGAGPELEAHIGDLRRKANDGTLRPAEDAVYQDFVEAVDLISIMQAKLAVSSPDNPGSVDPSLRAVVRSRAERAAARGPSPRMRTGCRFAIMEVALREGRSRLLPLWKPARRIFQESQFLQAFTTSGVSSGTETLIARMPAS